MAPTMMRPPMGPWCLPIRTCFITTHTTSLQREGKSYGVLVRLRRNSAGVVFGVRRGLSEFYDQPSIEAIELGTRLTARGFRVEIFSQLQVKHLKKWTLRS